MKLEVVKYDAEILRKRALPVDEISPEIIQLAEDMIETMIDSNGVGLAAPQIGRSLRMFILRDEKEQEDGEMVLCDPEVIINPHLSKPSEEKTSMSERCLSLPGLSVEVMRPTFIHVRYQNLKGEWIESRFDSFRARVAMHENDHLNGVLIVDRLDRNSRKKVESQLQAIKKRYADGRS